MEFESLYIHIPFCISKCVYCDFFSVPVSEVADDYVDALCNEIHFWLGGNVFWKSDCGQRNRSIKSVYIGGGTPSLLKPNQIKKITDAIYSNVSKKQILEFTVEVNPDDVTPCLLKAFSDCGVTRISCGIQSLSDDVLGFCKRRAKRVQILKAFELFEKEWNGELSLDFISGLPFETERSFWEGLETAAKTRANHISLYSLSIEDETPLGKMVESGNLLYSYDDSDKMWLLGRDYLKSKGFSQYEVSNFCKNGKMSIHNLGYWNHESYIGTGSGASGTKYNLGGTAFRWTNTNDLGKYIAFWKNSANSATERHFKIDSEVSQTSTVSNIPAEFEFLSRDTEIFEFFMMGLRTLSGVKKSRFEKTFAIPFPQKVDALFRKWSSSNLAWTDGENYALTEQGILFLNKFLEEL